MEGKERDTDGQNDFDERKLMGQAKLMSQGVDRSDEEIKILEGAQYRQMDADGAGDDAASHALGATCDQPPGGEGDHGTECQQQTKMPVPLGIKHIARHHQRQFAGLVVTA